MLQHLFFLFTETETCQQACVPVLVETDKSYKKILYIFGNLITLSNISFITFN